MKIAGRTYELQEPQRNPNKGSEFEKKPFAKIIVEGVNHPRGKPIRFKSVANAERHIRNMGLARDWGG